IDHSIAISGESEYGDVIDALTEIEKRGGRGSIQLAEGALPVTNLGKLYFPEAGFTKGDLLRYYAMVAPMLLPAIADRPLVLRRHPNGIHGKAFYQQQAPDTTPDGVRVEEVGSTDATGATRGEDAA